MHDEVLKKDAVVIGAGISGLATAYRLHQAGLDVLVLEKSRHIGGAIYTEEADGFTIDYGPNSILETSPKIRAFIEDIGLGKQCVAANASSNRRYILRHGRLLPLPMSPPQFLASKLFSGKAKLRLLREPFIPPAPSEREESIAEFVERRLGCEFLDYAINPFIAGVYAGDPKQLSVRSAVAKVYALEKNYGSLIKGAIKGARERRKRTDTAKTKAGLFSFKKGMGELSAALDSLLAKSIESETKVESIELPDESGGPYSLYYKSHDRQINVIAKSLIFTTPAYVTADYVKPFNSLLARSLAGIEYAPVAVVFLGFRKSPRCRPLDGFGFLVPEVENRRILGTIWSSTIFPNRAPENGAALTTFVGGLRQPDFAGLEDDRLTRLVLEELKDIMSLETTPDTTKIKRWPAAIPQYGLGHQRRIQAIETFETEHPGLFISGNFRNGISVGDCILQSEIVADRVCRFCERAPVSSKIPEKTEVLGRESRYV